MKKNLRIFVMSLVIMASIVLAYYLICVARSNCPARHQQETPTIEAAVEAEDPGETAGTY